RTSLPLLSRRGPCTSRPWTMTLTWRRFEPCASASRSFRVTWGDTGVPTPAPIPALQNSRTPRASGHWSACLTSSGPASRIAATSDTLPGRFVDWGAKIGIVTLGDQGAAIATRDGAFTVPALPGKVVDTTGAGDSFSAGFLVEYLRSGDAHRAAWFAIAVARHVIGGTGGVVAGRMPSRADIEALLTSHPQPFR
ncbi:MAG: hypothetical protein HYW08_08885, partial [candidate division NC10 bacterium]|nr:hypothetical protein [candidate division NC10 bacterium]